jgi:putative FmdB family regulatory protein
MAIYEYECSSCREITEAEFPIAMGGAPAIMCKCGKEAGRKFSTFGLVLRGGGWGSKP